MYLKNENNIRVGSLGTIHFPKGFYLYIGSALNGIEGRVKRHLSDSKKFHWHVDYLLRKANINDVFHLESKKKLECNIAGKFASDCDVVPDFGSSDCSCKSHLFFGNKNVLLDWALKCGLKEFNPK